MPQTVPYSPLPLGLSDYRFAAALTAAHRSFVASLIARLPAALSLRFFRAGVGPALTADPFLIAAHLVRCAAAILRRAAADIFRLAGVGSGAAPSVEAGVNIWRSSAI